MLPFIQSLRCAIPFYILRKMPWWIKAFLLNSCYRIFFFTFGKGLILLYHLVIKERVLIMNCDKKEVKKNSDRQIWYNDAEDNTESTILISWSFIYVQLQEKWRKKTFFKKNFNKILFLLTESLLESLLRRSREYVWPSSPLFLLVGK